MADRTRTVVLIGAGRMGGLIAEALPASGFELLDSYDVTSAAELDVTAPVAELAIDFSNRASLPHTLAYVRRTGAALLSGSDEELERIRAMGARVPVVWSANYSLGVAVLRRLAAEAAKALPGFDVEIVETHHNQKVDAPSGTAKLLLSAVDPSGEACVSYGREGMVGVRPEREIACAGAASRAPMSCTSLGPMRSSVSRTARRVARSS